MQRIQSLDDPRVAAYRNLRDRTLRGESIFVTEGPIVTRRLLASRYEAESVLVAERFAEEFEGLVAERTPLYVASPGLLREIVGYPFHQGVLAAGRRPEPLRLDDLLGSAANGTLGKVGGRWNMVCGEEEMPVGLPTYHLPPTTYLTSQRTLLVCPEINKPENMGLVFRVAAAFGIDGVLLGSRSCDPFARRSLRVSLGGVLQVPWVKTTALAAELRRLKDEWQFQLLAAVVDDHAQPLAEVRWPVRVGIVLGNEFTGLDDAALSLCDARVTIPMKLGMDSLNLGVAAGIFAYQRKFGRR